MENQQLGQKLVNISSMIQKQLIPPQPQNNHQLNRFSDDQRNVLNPVYYNKGVNLPPPQSQYNQQQYQPQSQMTVEQIIQDKQKFSSDVNNLLSKLDRAQSNRNINQYSPQQIQQVQQNEQTPRKASQFNYGVTQSLQSCPLNLPNQPSNGISPSNQQSLRQLKEENIELMKCASQTGILNQTCVELKQALNQSNFRLNELQKQLDSHIQINAQLKNDLIRSEQEKINQKRSFDEYIQNLQLAHKRDIQQLQFQYQEHNNVVESTLKQQNILQKTEQEQNQQGLQYKLAQKSKELLQIQENYNVLVTQFKDQQQNLGINPFKFIEKKIGELHIINSAFAEKSQQFEQLQQNYNNSLEKYELSTKQLIQNHNNRVQQYDQFVQELKQTNVQLNQQIEQLQAQHKSELELFAKNQQKYHNEVIDQLTNKNFQEKEQIQAIYEQRFQELNKDKEQLFQQKQQQALFLEQKIAVLVQENKDLAEQFKKLGERNQILEQTLSNHEQTLQNINRDSHIQSVQYNKQLKELSDLLNSGKKKQDTYQYTEKIQQLEQQVQYKKEELDLLLHHLDQVIEINKDYELKMGQLKQQMDSIQVKNNKENDAYFQQIKIQKQQLSDLQKKFDQSAKNEQQQELIIKELKNKVLNMEVQNENFKSLDSKIAYDAQKSQEDVKFYQNKTNDLAQKLQNSENANKKISAQNDILVKEASIKSEKFNKDLLQKQNKIQALEETIEELKQDKQNNLIQLENQKLKVSQTHQFQNKMNDLQLQISELQASIQQKDLEITTLHEQIKKYKKEKAQLSMQLMSAGMANLVTSQPSSNISDY